MVEMTALASSALTPKERANTGIAGARMPKPMATQKAMADRTTTSLGRSRSHGERWMTWCGRQELIGLDSILGKWRQAGFQQ